MRPPTAILFDFDGTLVDSFAGIEVAVNQAVAELLPEHTLPPLRPMIGPALRGMLERALPEARSSELDAVAQRFKTLYDGGLCLECHLYPEVEAVLRTLLSGPERPRAFIVTNKRLVPTRLLLDHFGIASLFEAVVASDAPVPFKSKIEAVAWTIEKFQLDVATTLFVGDSQDDFEAATSNGLDFLPVAYGYGNAPLHTTVPALASFSQLLTCLGLAPVNP